MALNREDIQKIKELCRETYTQSNLEDYGYTQKQGSEAIRQAFIELMGTDRPSRREFRRNETEIFEIIEDTVEPLISSGWEDTDFFERYVDYRDLERGDMNEFYIPDNSLLKAVQVSNGNLSIERQRLNVGKNIAISVSTYAVKVYEEFDRFIAGRISWPELVDKIGQALQHKLSGAIYTAFADDSKDALPSEFTHNGSFDDDELNTIIEHVRAANQGLSISIAGTRNALRKLDFSTNWISEQMKDQKNSFGIVADWEGVPLVEIPQVHEPNTFDFKITDSKLFVMPGTQPIKVVREGDPVIKETADGVSNMDMTLEYTYLTRWGVTVVFTNYYGIYEVT